MRTLAACLALSLLAFAAPSSGQNYKVHGIAMHGDLKYGPDFTHFDYTNPDAPKGGVLRRYGLGTFDSFNPFIIKGNPDIGSTQIYDTLLTASADEPFSEYGLLAESVETPQDRSWVIFTLRPQARWHDGQPITVEDVMWTFDTLRTKGSPVFRAYYASVDKVEKVGDRAVKFSFKPGENRELPLILGQLPVLPKHYWEKRNFENSTLDPPLGSAAYKIDQFEPGRWSTYKRVPDYWGKDLPVNRGRDNFDTLRFDYYRDMTVALEALKAGAYDLRLEASSKDWATAYDVPAVRDGALKKDEIPNDRPNGMQGYAFNLRRPLFQDRRVREALGYGFDSEWANRTLFYGQYRARAATSQTRAGRQRHSTGDELKVLPSPSAARYRRKCSPPSINRPPPTARATCATTCARRRSCSRPPVGRSIRRARSWSMPRDSRSSSRFCSSIRPTSASPCPSPRTSSASASPRACAPSIRRSTRSAPTISTSTS
jgi:microcin C transport system substrate-binding protein